MHEQTPCALSWCCREVCRLTDGSVALSRCLAPRHCSRLGRLQEGSADGFGAHVPAPNAVRAHLHPTMGPYHIASFMGPCHVEVRSSGGKQLTGKRDEPFGRADGGGVVWRHLLRLSSHRPRCPGQETVQVRQETPVTTEADGCREARP